MPAGAGTPNLAYDSLFILFRDTDTHQHYYIVMDFRRDVVYHGGYERSGSTA